MFLLYNLLLTLLSPVWVMWMLWRTYQRKEQPNWKERQGDYRSIPPRKESRPRIWVHAVSVGEFVAARPLLKELRQALPGHDIVLSVTTSSGHQTARAPENEGLYDFLVYFPIDVLRFQMIAMLRVRPDAVVIMETELWMNFLYAAKTFDAKTFLVNGRISDRSFPRSLKLRLFYRTLLSYVDACLMQSSVDVERIQALGAKAAEVAGNVKFDQALEGLDEDPEGWRNELGIDPVRPCIVVGSLRAEEFATIAPVLAMLTQQGVQVVVAPRHLERTPELIKALGGAPSQRSLGAKMTNNLLILDSYGELSRIYSVADIAILGGGFEKLGGQNLVQPLALGKPVLHGKYMHNFRDVAALAERVGAARVCEDAESLKAAVTELISDEHKRKEMGEAAKKLVADNAGASRRYAERIAREVTEATKKVS